MLTGGAYWHQTNQNGDPSLNAWILSSAPTSDSKGWYVTGRNVSGMSLDLTTVVKCLAQNVVGTYSTRAREVTVDAHRSGNADLRCKSGQKVVTGGGVWHKPGAQPKPIAAANLSMSFPDTDQGGWSAAGHNDGASQLILRVTAFCVPASVLGATYVAKHQLVFVNSFSYGQSYVPCDSGDLAASGGLWWGGESVNPGDPDGFANTDTHAVITSSVETGDSTSWYGAGRNADSRWNNAGLVVDVLCLPT